MRKFKITKHLFYLLIFSLYLFSCTPEEDIKTPSVLKQNNFVELFLVKDIAENISFPNNIKSISAKGIQTSVRTTKSIDEIKNSDGLTAFYVVNYNEGGFILLSADYRTPPILGFSFYNNFSINENLFPEGLKYWVNETKKQVSDIQKSNIVQTENEKIAWRQIQNTLVNNYTSSNKEPDDPPCYEHTDIYTKGPLLSTIWYQSGGFNDALPYITCNGNPFQVLAGCVPIAMAQVMKYYQYPSSYDWVNMPLGYGTNTTANFIKDIHNAITASYGSSQPIYNCGSTGVSSAYNMGTVLKTQFDYSSADWANYNENVVKNNIEINRPVILSGDNGTTGHMWVCDGYRISTFYFSDCTAVGYLHFYMNWGWQNGEYNGWYAYNNFNPGNINFNSNKKIIYNIIP